MHLPGIFETLAGLFCFRLLHTGLTIAGFEHLQSREFTKMEKTEYRAVIKYLNLKGLNSTQIHTDMTDTLGDQAPSFATVKRWVAESKRGREY